MESSKLNETLHSTATSATDKEQSAAQSGHRLQPELCRVLEAAFCTDRGLRMHPSALRSGNPESPGIPTSRHNMLPGFISLLLPGLRGSLSLSLMLRIETKYTKELPAQLHGLPLGRVGSCAPVGNEGADVFRAHVDFQLRSLANTIKLRNTCTP